MSLYQEGNLSIIFFVTLAFLSLSAEACLNLTGNLSGGCVYRSPSFGDLNGSIEFKIQQPTCNEITIDGSFLEIPGQFESKTIDGPITDYVKLAMSWKDATQDTLNFQYIRTVDENNQRVDDVSLNGFFKKAGTKFIFRQSGIVDQDPVEIYCELFK